MLYGDRVATVSAAGDEIATQSFDDADALITFLTDAVGAAPTHTDSDIATEGECMTASIDSWSEQLQLTDKPDDPAYPTLNLSTKSATVGSLAITTPDGLQVGDDATASLAAYDASQSAYSGFHLYDTVGTFTAPPTGETVPYGAGIVVDPSNIVTAILAHAAVGDLYC